MRTLSLLPSSPKYPTASELHRARECVAPWALGLPEVRETNEWAEFGRKLHWWAEQAALGVLHEHPVAPAEYHAALALVVPSLDVDRALAKRFTWPDICVTALRSEIGIKWRPGVLEDEAALCDRQPGERLRGWFSGTADLVYVRADGVLVVADWKFGPREHVTGEPAKESCQGFFLAMAFAQLLGIRGSSAGVVVARFERRMVREDGIEVDGYDITQGDLDGFAEQLRSLAKRIDSAVDATPRISVACGKCKAKAACPGWEALGATTLAAMTTEVEDALFRPPTNADDARKLHHAIGAANGWSSEWKRWLDAYVLTHPEGVPIGLGLRLKAIPSKDREALDTPEALDVIERIAGPKAIEVVRKSGIGLIKAAARDSVDKSIKSTSDRDKSKKAAEERVFAELVQAGAVVDKGKKLTVRVVRSDEEE